MIHIGTEPSLLWDWFWLVNAFAIGAIVGSFLNVVISRLPQGESVVTPGSKCPNCDTPIRFFDNVPIFSYLILLGKCRACGQTISPRYPINEFVMALLSGLLMARFGPTPYFGVWFVVVAAMLATFWIDLDNLIIPDIITLPLIPLGLLASFLGWVPEMNWRASIYGILLGGVILWAPAFIYEKIRGIEGLGGGDIKLLAMIGVYVGPYGVVFVLFMSSLIGSAFALVGIMFKRADSASPIPFGPFITAAAVFYIFYGYEIVDMFFGTATF